MNQSTVPGTIAESQLTTPNRTIEASNGVTYAYRRYGTATTGALPLVLLQHFRGNLDNWDPPAPPGPGTPGRRNRRRS
jgi:hypothetical protein